MNAEVDLLRAVLAARSVAPLVQKGVTGEYFVGASACRLYNTIVRHQAKYGRVPAAATLKEQFPDLDLTAPEEDFEVYIDAVRDQHNIRLLSQGVAQAAKALATAEKDASFAWTSAVGKLQGSINAVLAPTARGDTIDLTKTGEARWERYQAFKDVVDGLRGAPTGFPSIDRLTLGLQPQQLITIAGLPKDGKSTLLVTMARNAHRYYHECGVEFMPLIFGFEMSNDEQSERLDSWNAGLDTRKLRAGELSVIEWKKLRQALDELAGMSPFYLATGMGSATGISEIDERLDELKPDAAYIDGVYMMRDEISGEVNTPTALTNITRAFKRLAQRRSIPIVITTQALSWKVGKQGVQANSIGYSSSFFQDSDLLLAPERTGDPDLKLVKIIGARNGPTTQVLVKWDWTTGTYEEIPEDEGGDYAF